MGASPVIAYLSLGSNLGDRREHLRRACRALETHQIRLLRFSSLYETAPVDVVDQDWFLNCVVEVETTFSPPSLLDELQQIEHELGRRRERLKGPRTLDIDILLYGDVILSTPELVLPHPRMCHRRFVLEPLREIAPGLPVPKFRKTVEQCWRDLRNSAPVRRIEQSSWL